MDGRNGGFGQTPGSSGGLNAGLGELPKNEFINPLDSPEAAESEDLLGGLGVLDVLKMEPIDSVGKITVTLDKMRVFLNISLPMYGGKPLSGEDIRNLIAANNVVYGLRELTITRLIQSPLYDRDVMIAEGTAPQRGKDGNLIYHIRLTKDAVPHINEDGSVNYKDLGLIENVEKDQLLVTKIPPELGIDGKDVTGAVIKAQPGKELPLPIGKNTYITEDGLELRASIIGQSDFADRKVHVNDTFVVKGDVSTSTGNINFVGNVVVSGNVLAGFTVEAGGNIDISGCVEGSRIIAGGNVIIRDGFHGMYKGEIVAGGGVRSKYIQAGRVQAGGIIETQVLLQANVQSSESIKLVGNRSTIMGGRTMAKNIIDCQFIGGKNNPVPTIIEVGSDPHLIVRQRDIENETAALIKSIADIDRLLVLFRQLGEQNRLTPDKREMQLRSAYTRKNSGERLLALKAEEEELKLKLAAEGYGTVIARGAIYPGVRVVIGPEQQLISSPVEGVMLVRGEEGLQNNPVRL